MVLSFSQLKKRYADYHDVGGKVNREVEKGNLFRLKRGLYETDGKTDGLYLTSFILSPSYVSFQYALSYHGLIPERAVNYTSATFNQKKAKSFSNHFGNYYYRDVPINTFPYHVDVYEINGYSYFIATKEKALCDMLYISRVTRTVKDLKDLLFKDLRLDYIAFSKLDFNKILFLTDKYKSTNINLLKELIEKEYLND